MKAKVKNTTINKEMEEVIRAKKEIKIEHLVASAIYWKESRIVGAEDLWQWHVKECYNQNKDFCKMIANQIDVNNIEATEYYEYRAKLNDIIITLLKNYRNAQIINYFHCA